MAVKQTIHEICPACGRRNARQDPDGSVTVLAHNCPKAPPGPPRYPRTLPASAVIFVRGGGTVSCVMNLAADGAGDVLAQMFKTALHADPDGDGDPGPPPADPERLPGGGRCSARPRGKGGEGEAGMTRMLFPNDSLAEVRLPCISMWRPWAGWVALGWKTIETRLHARFAGLRGQRVGIHAAQRWDAAAIEAARPYLSPEQVTDQLDQVHGPGRVICTAFVADARWLTVNDSAAAMIDCGTVRRYGLVLADVRILPACDATRVSGRQGLFYLDIGSEADKGEKRKGAG